MSKTGLNSTTVRLPCGSSRSSWPLSDAQPGDVVRNRSTSSVDWETRSRLSPIRLPARSSGDSPDTSPVRGSLNGWSFATRSTYIGHTLQQSPSNVQSNHQAPKQACRGYEKMMVSDQADRGVTASQLQDVFSTLERYKQEHHLALQAMRTEMDARINKLEDTIHPLYGCLKAMQNQRNDEQEHLNDIVTTAKDDLVQIKRDILTTLASSISCNMNQLSVGYLFPKSTTSTDHGSTLLSQDSYTNQADVFAKSTANIKKIFQPIIAKQFDSNQMTQEMPQESCATTNGAQGLTSSMYVEGDPLEEKHGSPSRAGKALKYIMENSSRLERAAFGLAQEVDNGDAESQDFIVSAPGDLCH